MMKNLKKRLKDQRGLTLVELLAVIVILGIVAAIAVPSIGGIINKSKDDAIKAEAIQIIQAAKLYIASEGFTLDASSTTTQTIDQSKLAPFLDNVKDNDFDVVVVDNGTKYTYYLSDHNVSTLITATEGDPGIEESSLVD